MPGLLDYVKGYQYGGGVDYDPYADTNQADMLLKLGISVNPDAMGLLPTYDPAGANMAREAYSLRKAGLSDAFATARRGGTSSLLDLSQQGQQQQAGSLFAGHGAISRGMANVRSDIISGFGDISSDFGRKQDQAYLDLQQDIYGMRQGYERDLISAVGDLPEGSWSFGASGDTGDDDRYGCAQQCQNATFGSEAYRDCVDRCNDQGDQDDDIGDDDIGDDDIGDDDIGDDDTVDICNEQCSNFAFDSPMYNQCIDECEGGTTGDDADDENQCPDNWFWNEEMGKCQQTAP